MPPGTYQLLPACFWNSVIGNDSVRKPRYRLRPSIENRRPSLGGAKDIAEPEPSLDLANCTVRAGWVRPICWTFVAEEWSDC